MAFYLDVLGHCDLRRGDGSRVQSVVQQPRRLALLIYLAIASRAGPVRRESVLDVFWPESAPSKARGALNQALFKLRRSLGPKAIKSVTANELLVDQAVIHCDVVKFLDSVESGAWEEAVGVYKGELLPGFGIGNATASFDQWLDHQRERLRRCASDAAWQIAGEAEDEGDLTKAALWARRAADWSGEDEIHVRRLMLALDRMNDKPGVLAAYQALESRLESLDAKPSSTSQQLLEDLRSNWDEDQEGSSGGSGEEQPSPEPVGASPPISVLPAGGHTREGFTWSRRRRLILAAMVGVVAILVMLMWASSYRSDGDSREAPVTLLLEPFDVLQADSTMPRFLGGAVGRHLMDAGDLQVVMGSEGSVHDDGFVLSGVITTTPNGLQVNTHLRRRSTGRLIRARRITTEATDPVSAMDSAGGEIAAFARRALGDALETERIQRSQVPPKALALFKLAQDGRRNAHELGRANNVAEARSHFQKVDSLLAQVAEIAPGWKAPLVERARNAQALSWLEHSQGRVDLAEIVGRRGLGYADDALRGHSAGADALDARAKILGWLRVITLRDPPPEHGEWLMQLEKDARQLIEQEPARPHGWKLLAAAAWDRGDFATAHWALTNALSTDTFLQEEQELLIRLFLASWEIGNRLAAEKWCHEYHRRFPHYYLGYDCRLMLIADDSSRGAVEVQETLASARAAGVNGRRMAQLELVAAVAYAKDGNREKGLALLRGLGEEDQQYHAIHTAWAWLSLGDTTRAEDILWNLTGGDPQPWMHIARSRRFRDLDPFRVEK